MIQRLSCPLCGRPAGPIFSRSYGLPQLQAMIARAEWGGLPADKSYELRHCAACAFHFQTWVMDEPELASWYSPPVGPDFFRQEIARQRLHSIGHALTEILVFRQLCPETMPVVLDFGCHWGKWAGAALALGCDVYGVDVNRDAADFCARRGIRMVDRAELGRLRFDFINVDQVMEHLSDPLSIARELAGCLKPGGFLKLSTPGNSRLPKILRKAQTTGDNAVLDQRTLDPVYPLEHVNLFTRAALQRVGETVGLREFRQPLMKWLGAGQLWNIPRQFNMNLVVAFKRRLGRGTYVWFRASTG
jgi:SAM-dependent methyltransferase